MEAAANIKNCITKLSKSVQRYANCKANIPKENRKKYKENLRNHYQEFLEIENLEEKIEMKPEVPFELNKKGQIKINENFIVYCENLEKYKRVGK